MDIHAKMESFPCRKRKEADEMAGHVLVDCPAMCLQCLRSLEVIIERHTVERSAMTWALMACETLGQ